jgi:hypothetical protein
VKNGHTKKSLAFLQNGQYPCEKFKRNEPFYELEFSVYLSQVRDVNQGGVFDKFLAVNGRRFYMQGTDTRSMVNLIKATAQTAPVQPMNLFGQIPAPSQIAPAPQNSPVNGIYCASCGKPNQSDASYCIACGQSLKK